MSSNKQENPLGIAELKCNYMHNPLGVETLRPRLSWVLQSDMRGQLQTAYQILAAGSSECLKRDEGDLWDSGKVVSEQSIDIAYQGEKLHSRQGCFWKVRVWDREGHVSPWSEAAYWEMGLLENEDWRARWIGSPVASPSTNGLPPAPLFRKEFELGKMVQSARVYACGLGYNELYINGNRVGEEVLQPGFTKYDATVLYNTYDVTKLMHQGCNAIGVILGNGWYNCFTTDVWEFEQAPWRANPKLLLQVNILFEDGEELVVYSDDSWHSAASPIIFNGVRNGEIYDARMEKNGWSEPGYDDRGWTHAYIVRSPGGALKSQQMTPIKVTGHIEPKSVKEVQPGVWVYDLGQNISGWAWLKVSGPAGTCVTLKYAEKIKEDGDIDQSNIDPYVNSGEFQTDKYILKGEGIETWEPRFTYHGFQYVQVSGFPGVPSLDNLTGCVVHTAFGSCGEFSCSNELLNKIQKCTRWSSLGNFFGIPTDCPHREKNGWTGDAQLSAEQLLLNFDPVTAYTKWLQDFKDVQRLSGQLPGIIPTGGWGYNWGSGPAWDSAVILIPWYMYVYCGDTAILESMYDAMRLYVNYMTSMSNGHIVNFGLGDWCPPNAGADGHKCPTVVTDTAYYYVDTLIVSKVAALLGQDEDAAKYRALAREVRQAFRNRFVNSQTGVVEGDCQTSMACALYQGLADEDEKPKMLQALVEQVEKFDRHIDCGILGAKYVMHALTDLGRADLAYAMASQTTYPSWGHWIEQGATTLWETWNGDSSRNHHMFGDISAWFYKGLAGINPDPEVPGFRHIILHPNPVDGLQWVNAWHKSMYGQIVSNWKKENGKLLLEVEIPVNCTASIYLPADKPEDIKEGGQSLSLQPDIHVAGQQGNNIVLQVGSGKYSFEVDK